MKKCKEDFEKYCKSFSYINSLLYNSIFWLQGTPPGNVCSWPHFSVHGIQAEKGQYFTADTLIDVSQMEVVVVFMNF